MTAKSYHYSSNYNPATSFQSDAFVHYSNIGSEVYFIAALNQDDAPGTWELNFISSPVPELPESAMFLAGLGMLAFISRRKVSSKKFKPD